MSNKKSGRPQIASKVKKGPGFLLANWLNENLNEVSGMTNEEIADELGYSKPNIVSMFKTGKTKVPLAKLTKFSSILKQDLLFLLPLYLEQYIDTDGYDEVRDAMARAVNESEADLINKIRLEFDGKPVELIEGKEDLLKECIQKISESKKQKDRNGAID